MTKPRRPGFLRRARAGGVGRALVECLTTAARRQRVRQLRADASIGAREFFRSLGFRQVRVQVTRLRGRALRRYRMERRIG